MLLIVRGEAAPVNVALGATGVELVEVLPIPVLEALLGFTVKLQVEDGLADVARMLVEF